MFEVHFYCSTISIALSSKHKAIQYRLPDSRTRHIGKTMTDKSLRKRVEAIKRQKIAGKKVVSLSDFREMKSAIETRTILVVDDDEIMRSALKRILEGENHKVLMAEDGLELSKVLETTRLDMVLLDINLPWVDGFELCRLIKDHHSLKNVPLLLVSGRKAPEDIEKGFESGADEYVTKPFDIDEMLKTINKYFTAK